MNQYTLFEQVVIGLVVTFSALVAAGLVIGLVFAIGAEKVRQWKATERGYEMTDETRDIEF